MQTKGGLGSRSRQKPLPEGMARGVLDDHPRLDMRTLINAGHAVSGQRSSAVIDWADATPLIDGLRFVIDLRTSVEPHIELEMMRQGQPTYQSLRLMHRGPGGRSRWCFVCPVSGTACEVVALRYGRFASAKAQRLVNRSQLGKPRRHSDAAPSARPLPGG